MYSTRVAIAQQQDFKTVTNMRTSWMTFLGACSEHHKSSVEYFPPKFISHPHNTSRGIWHIDEHLFVVYGLYRNPLIPLRSSWPLLLDEDGLFTYSCPIIFFNVALSLGFLVLRNNNAGS